MYISAKVDYAVRALVLLASNAEGMTAATIAATERVSLAYMARTLSELSRSGVVVRAEAVGYRLARPTALISLAEVFSAVGEPILEVHGRHLASFEHSDASLAVRGFWDTLRQSIHSLLATTTVEDLQPRTTTPSSTIRTDTDPAAAFGAGGAGLD